MQETSGCKKLKMGVFIMDIEYMRYLDNLNHENAHKRLQYLKKLMQKIDEGQITRPKSGNDVNNHIHTFYSFSPYSPTKAVWLAYNAGLKTAGIMDHDSISGAKEFIEAGKIVRIATTIGVECRADFSKTALNGKRINNPDQDSIAYVAIHGIPHTQIHEVKDYFAPYVRERNKRNRLMLDNINQILKPFGIYLDFEYDVVPISKSHEGGSITERHLLYALSLKLVEKYEKGERLVDFLKKDLKLQVNPRVESYLLDGDNPFYEYDLLGLLKSDLVAQFYIDATLECPDVKEVVELSNSIGAIVAYAYLGDVGDSVTGDKKSQKFEDDYLDLLFEIIKKLGFNAITYMPSRNTINQLKRVKALCQQYGFFEISGEDINSPRQSFVCDALKNDEFKNLIDSTWALIGHEKVATSDIRKALFSRETVNRYPDLYERIDIYRKFGLGLLDL
jgi:predicted metal-dependent phosphoesterase TrpH